MEASRLGTRGAAPGGAPDIVLDDVPLTDARNGSTETSSASWRQILAQAWAEWLVIFGLHGVNLDVLMEMRDWHVW